MKCDQAVQVLPLSLRDQEPRRNRQRQADPGVEPAGLEPPVPLGTVDHVRRENVHDDARHAGQRGAETCRVGPEALRGDFSDVALAGGAIHDDAHVYRRVSLQNDSTLP